MPRSLQLAICVLAIGFLTTAARADVIYTFTGVTDAAGITPVIPVEFRYTSPDFLPGADAPENTGIVVFASQLDSCLNCMVSSIVHAVDFGGNVFDGFQGSQIGFNDNLNRGTVFMFPLGAFATPGTYTSTTPFSSATLTVVAVPEPNSLFMALICMMMLPSIYFWRRGLTHRTFLS